MLHRGARRIVCGDVTDECAPEPRSLLGAAAAVGELVPYIGPMVAALPAVALALLDSPQEAVTVALAYVVIQQVEGNVVSPFVLHSQTDVSPATVLFAVVAGFAAAGILGAVAAVPLFAAARVLMLRVVAPWARCVALRRRRNDPPPLPPEGL